MTKLRKYRDNRCSGEIMIEALIVYPVIIGMLFFVIALFSIYYQHWHYNIIADEIAMRIAQTYKYENSNVLTGEIKTKDISDLKPLRYWFWSGDMERGAKSKAKKIASAREENFFAGEDITVETEVKKDTMGRRHVAVKLSCKYSVPFRGMLEYFGMEDVTSCKITTYADCFDMTNYMNSVDFIAHITNSSKLNIINETIEFVEHIIGKA